MAEYKKKLIEVALPLEEINAASAREKSIRHGHPSTLHLWWARRPLAACRAVLFAQLVDDPSAHPDQFPTEEDQEKERERLFDIIRELVKWENTNNEKVLKQAHAEILKSCDGKPPAVYDPFSGGGSIPLEAQRLGLEAYGSDLNPVAVMIGKALIEIPPKFAGMPPINPEYRATHDVEKELSKGLWTGAKGLAEDVRYYGKWMRDRAFEEIGYLFPPVELPDGSKATVVAWIWARTVASPNPVLGGIHVPLVKTFKLSTKKGKEAWVEPIISEDGRSYKFEVKHGSIKAIDGTINRRGGRCLLSNAPISFDWIRAEASQGRMKSKLMAIVASTPNGRIYLSPNSKMEKIAQVAEPQNTPETELPEKALGFRVQRYGMQQHKHLFTNRQLVVLDKYSSFVGIAKEKIIQDLSANDVDERRIFNGSIQRIDEYADAVATYLGLALSKIADALTSLARWKPSMDQAIATFSRQAIPMVWDYAESNTFNNAAGDYQTTIKTMARVISSLPASAHGSVVQADAINQSEPSDQSFLISTDPPYFDNVGYADLSDFFYVWLRRSIKNIYPAEFSTLYTPKFSELVANPYRHGGREKAEFFFLSGMKKVIDNIRVLHPHNYPVTIYYAFKQSESKGGDFSSTGWEAFLEAIIQSGLSLYGTWPMRTELGNRMVASGTNALASSIVLVCRKQSLAAPVTTRGDFIKNLRKELPHALITLQHSNIAPVDLAQASIGPGMAIFTRYSKVMEADGSPMTVRTALQLINKALDEYLAEQEGEYDPDTRFAITWFQQFGMEPGDYGIAETLATARNVSVQGVEDAGILEAKAGKVRLLRRTELPEDWNPLKDNRLCAWEATQHLIQRYQATGGETAPAQLLNQLNHKDGSIGQIARDLAYRLYAICDRKKWTDEALAYNSLVTAWPDIVARATEIHQQEPVQTTLDL